MIRFAFWKAESGSHEETTEGGQTASRETVTLVRREAGVAWAWRERVKLCI